MPQAYVRTANEYKKNFEFLSDGTNKCNCAYHMQFIEHCYREKQTLTRTTKSLTNRSIVVELGSIIELCLHEILSSLKVELLSQRKKSLNISDKEPLGPLIKIAANYEIIDSAMKSKLGALCTYRNSIHFKRYREKRILEYNYHKDTTVNEFIKTFEEFMKATHTNIKGTVKTFVWPWN